MDKSQGGFFMLFKNSWFIYLLFLNFLITFRKKTVWGITLYPVYYLLLLSADNISLRLPITRIKPKQPTKQQ